MFGDTELIFWRDSVIFCIPILIFLPSLNSEIAKYNVLILKKLRKSFDGCLYIMFH